MSTKLSFCIPTFNFGLYIGQTLASILEQAEEQIQIVIVDGGSSDGTQAIVAEVAAQYPGVIKFIQREKRYGIDLDILESVQHADGEYCWLFSSDDLVAPGALARVTAAIGNADWDVLLLGITCCDLEMNPVGDHPILGCRKATSFDWSDAAERADYFSRACTTTAFCSFISDVVVRRDRWLGAPPVDRYIGSCWIIAAKMFAMAQQGLHVRFDPSICINKRGDNDSFAAQGQVRRIDLSIRGFRALAEDFFGRGSMEAQEVSRVVANEYPLLDLLDLKRRLIPQRDLQQTQQFYKLARLHYPSSSFDDRLRYLFLRWTPAWVLASLRPMYRGVIAILGPKWALKSDPSMSLHRIEADSPAKYDSRQAPGS